MSPSPTHRDLLLETAQRLILTKGFPATKVDEICAQAGVTKGSFYYHFDSKDHLADVLVDHYFEALATRLTDGGWQNEPDPVERFFAFLHHAIAIIEGPMLRNGCLLGSFALDLSETHPEIRRAIEARFDSLAAAIEPTIRAALKQQGVSKSVNAGMLARQFIAVLQGSIVIAKAYGDHAKVTESMRCFLSMCESLLAA